MRNRHDFKLSWVKQLSKGRPTAGTSYGLFIWAVKENGKRYPVMVTYATGSDWEHTKARLKKLSDQVNLAHAKAYGWA